MVLLAWIIGGLVGDADDQPVQGTAGAQRLPAPSSPAPSDRRAGSPSATTSPTATTAPTTSSTAKPAGSRAATSSSAAPPSSAPPSSATVPPGPPRACTDAEVKVAAQPGAPSYRVGEHPLLRLVVVNAGKVGCTRDLSRKLRELVITTADGKRRLWSSNDCYGPPGTDRRTLAPGKSLEFTVNWAGRTSAPGCPVNRTTVPAGKYRVIGKLGKLGSVPTPLTLKP